MANQTHKTIIFEEFDSSTDNLYTIINNDPSDNKLAEEIENKLLVKSFEEFMEKFAPKVYEVAWREPDSGNIKFLYTTDPTKFAGYPNFQIKISDHAFYRALAKLYETRGSTGQSNLKFDDREIMEMLTPKKELEEARDIRQKMDYNLQLYYEAEARGDRSEMNLASDKVMECREKISEYASSPLNKLLPILIDDIDKKLELLGSGVSSDGTKSDTPKALPSYGVLYLNEAGQLDILDNQKRETVLKALPSADDKKGGSLVVANDNHPAQITTLPAKPAQNKSESPVPDKQTLHNQIAETIVMDYEEEAEIQNEQVKSLIVSTFAPLAANKKIDLATLDEDKLVATKKMYENAYASARQSFANEMSRIVESLLGVKTFFDHATVDGGESSQIPEGVIIANCKASRLLKIKDKFTSKMKLLGKDQGRDRIWFAVVPSVFEKPPVKNDTNFEKTGPLGGPLRRKKDSAEKISDDYVNLNALKEFIEIMEKAKIMTVFNIRAKNGNTFADLTAAEVQNKIETFETCNYSHAAYAYPNFTLINERILKPFEGQDTTEINLPGIFIDAAYPAAGLLVASQQTKVLDGRKLKYDRESPCVSVNFEELEVKKKLPTKFNREAVLRRSEDLIRAINENMFGFAFSGDEVKDNDGVWKNSYVHCARTLAKNKKTGNYKPIYQTLTEDYIAQDLNLLASKSKEEVEKRIKRINKDCEDKNGQKNRYAGCVNLLLRENEKIDEQLSEDSGKIKILVHFAGGDSYVEIDVESD
ncbi:MAG: hypothetical protein IJQ85_01575 [Selenomonadaceae bacterium]|nr:hypothetical protein [Selenomonadaceae bacterium]